MRVNLLSLFLSLAFVSVLTFEYISDTLIPENSSSKNIEYVLEKRLIDKYIEDSYILSSISMSLNLKIKNQHIFKQTFYNFKSTNILYRPPINI